jgi:mono/diheme cytochrome c family protein
MTLKKLTIASLTFLSVTILSTSCSKDHDDTGLEYAPQMYEPVGPEPYEQVGANSINPMGLNMRLPAQGTVARPNYHTRFGTENDTTSVDLMIYNIPKDSIAIAERTLTNPIPQTDKTLEEGKLLYGRYCIHCHGEGGKGDGLVGKQYKGVPSYSADAYKTMNDGHIFHVITHGKGRMWPHGSQMTPEERWKIVQYVHKLQQG